MDKSLPDKLATNSLAHIIQLLSIHCVLLCDKLCLINTFKISLATLTRYFGFFFSFSGLQGRWMSLPLEDFPFFWIRWCWIVAGLRYGGSRCWRI